MVRGVLAAGLVFALAGGCGGREEAADGRLAVVASAYPLYEAAGRVAGDRAEVRNLTPRGAEPHDLEVTTDLVDAVLDADLVFYLGGGFQPAVEDLALGRGARAVDLLGADRRGDPHVWLDPKAMARIATRIERALIEVDPNGRVEYETNAAAFRDDLTALDRRFEATLARCQRKVIVTAHAAFGHLARRYGFVQEALVGLSPEAEPDPARLAEVADLVASTGTTTVFTEDLTSTRVAEALAREAGVATAVLHPLEERSPQQAADGATYLSLMDENRRALAAGLGCEGRE